MTGNGLPPGAIHDRSAPWSDEAYRLAEEQECDELTPEECTCEHGVDLLEDCPECQKSSEDKLVEFIKSDIRNTFDGYAEGMKLNDNILVSREA